MEQKQYPAFLNTKEDYEFAVNNFPREYWEDDIYNLYSDALYCEPIGTQKVLEGIPNTEILVDEPDEETVVKWHKEYDNKDYEYIGRTSSDIEIRQYEDEDFRTVVKLISKPGSKAAKLGIDLVWLENVALFKGNEQMDAYTQAINQLKEENAELEKVIARCDDGGRYAHANV